MPQRVRPALHGESAADHVPACAKEGKRGGTVLKKSLKLYLWNARRRGVSPDLLDIADYRRSGPLDCARDVEIEVSCLPVCCRLSDSSLFTGAVALTERAPDVHI